MKGEWKLLYSTVSILGSRRTKLGLRDFITLGDFIQVIDVEKVNLMRRLKCLFVSLFHAFDMEWQVFSNRFIFDKVRAGPRILSHSL